MEWNGMESYIMLCYGTIWYGMVLYMYDYIFVSGV